MGLALILPTRTLRLDKDTRRIAYNHAPEWVALRPIDSQNGCAHLLADVFLSSPDVGLVGLGLLNLAP